ncbi:MAG: PIN domain-containing protein [Limisphaerales bacterium]|jgi:predicted nucleic acid-binding protein
MRTFLDSGVLLTAWKGESRSAEAAEMVLDDTSREFVTCQMVKLELLPKPTYFNQLDELAFYNTHFEQVKQEEPLSEGLAREALALACAHGLAAADALNMAAALRLKAQEFVTTEAKGKPLFRVPGIKVTSLHVAAKTPAPPASPRSSGSN